MEHTMLTDCLKSRQPGLRINLLYRYGTWTKYSSASTFPSINLLYRYGTSLKQRIRPPQLERINLLYRYGTSCRTACKVLFSHLRINLLYRYGTSTFSCYKHYITYMLYCQYKTTKKMQKNNEWIAINCGLFRASMRYFKQSKLAIHSKNH